MTPSNDQHVRAAWLRGAACLGALLLCLLLIAWPEAQAKPSTLEDKVAAAFPVPPVNARAYLVFDAADEILLAEENSDEPVPIASITKMMTALIVADHADGTDEVTISKAAAAPAIRDIMLELKQGEKMTVDDLMATMVVHSSNDAALALAEHVGGSEEAFIDRMNDRAKELGMDDTTFTSVNGLDEEGNVSSAADVLTMTQEFMDNPDLARLASTKKVEVTHEDGSVSELPNRNRLLSSYDGVDGVKTGHTDLAGYCLVTHYEDKDGSDLYTVVLGTIGEDARDAETVKLLDWARELRPKLTLASTGDIVGSAPIAFSDKRVGLYVGDDIEATVRIGSTLEERIVVPGLLEPPLRAGDDVGTYELLIGDKVVGKSTIYIDKDVKRVSTRGKVTRVAQQWRRAAREGWSETRAAGRRIADYWGM